MRAFLRRVLVVVTMGRAPRSTTGGAAASVDTRGRCDAVAIILICPHCPSVYESDGVRPPFCPICLKPVRHHQWRVAEPKKFEFTDNDKRFILKPFGILAD